MSQDKSRLKFSTIPSFGSVVQRQDFDQIPDNYAFLDQNISGDKPGTASKRNGIPLLGTTRTGSVKGLLEWTANTSAVDATKRIRMWRGQSVASNYDLDILSQPSFTYTTIDGSQAAIGNMESVNYIDKVYHISPSNYLSYETGSVIANVSTAMIKAKCLAVSQNTLFAGNVTTLNSLGVDYQSRVYYSDFSSNLPTDSFYDVAKGQTIASSTNFFTVLAPVVGLFNFSATGLLYVFTRDSCYSFDVRLLENRIGPLKKFEIGLINTRSICECNGWMIWQDYEGRLWGWSGQGSPMPISWGLQDDENGEAILSQLNRSDLSVFCAGALNNKFYFSLGQDITFKGKTIPNAVLKGILPQTMDSVDFHIDSFPVKPSIFRVALIGTNKKLIFGSSTTDDAYVINSGLIDGTASAIDAGYYTKFIDFGMPLYDKQFKRLFIKYRPQPTPGTYLKVMWAVNGNTNYTTLSDPTYVGPGIPATGTVIAGTVDMNIGYNSGNQYLAIQVLKLPSECQGKNISIYFGNNKVSQDFEISALSFEYELVGYELNPRTS